MEPIISPWLIYLLGITEDIKTVFISSSVFAGIGLVIYMVLYIATTIDDSDRKMVRRFSFCPYLFTIFLLFAIIIPSKNTLIGMIVAQQITPNNISSVIKMGKDLKNELKKDVMYIIESATKEKPKEER